MAAAEARTAWQRTVNRYFVQEDAKRAPKLACCQSSSSTSKQEDAGPVSGGGGSDNPPIGLMPLKREPSLPNIPPDVKWWLQMQPNYCYQKGFTSENASLLNTELESMRHGVNSTARVQGIQTQKKEEGTGHFNSETHCDMSIEEVREFNVMCREKSQERLSDTSSYYEVMEMDCVDSSFSKQTSEFGINSDFPWLDVQNPNPWWKSADKDELASLVARKSLDSVENCDLPRTQKVCVKGSVLGQSGQYDHGGLVSSSFNTKTPNHSHCNPVIHARDSLSTFRSCGMQSALIREKHLRCGSDISINDDTFQSGMLERSHITETDPSKSQLLEALCHSQTRAREAEKAAKRANIEKEHIMKLFFKQASQLFAYKQWLQLLQHESFNFQFRNQDPPIPLLPVLPAWMPYGGRKSRRTSHKGDKGKLDEWGGFYFDNYTLALALGLSLVGAGLLLGWTVGWMLPTL